MADLPACPRCQCAYTYASGDLVVCPECFHEWNPLESGEQPEESSTAVLDAHGQVLVDGDTVMLIKDLPVKGSLRPLKTGTRVKNIRLVDGDHNISCRIDGFGAMALKSEFVKKVS